MKLRRLFVAVSCQNHNRGRHVKEKSIRRCGHALFRRFVPVCCRFTDGTDGSKASATDRLASASQCRRGPVGRRHSSKVGAVCSNPACTDLCGGRWATGVPTATESPSSKISFFMRCLLRVTFGSESCRWRVLHILRGPARGSHASWTARFRMRTRL